jgi:hypothetical protein
MGQWGFEYDDITAMKIIQTAVRRNLNNSQKQTNIIKSLL